MKKCSACGNSFTCGAGNMGGACWCADFPTIMPTGGEQDCLCPACLARAVRKRIDAFVESASLEEAVRMAQQYSRPGPPREGIDYDIEAGSWVFTRWYHLKRGSCCGNACRNCPYNHEAVGRSAD